MHSSIRTDQGNCRASYGTIQSATVETGPPIKKNIGGQRDDGFSVKRCLIMAKNRADDCNIFRSEIIDIEAPIDRVFALVKNLEDYGRMSNGAIEANVLDVSLMVGGRISLKVYPNTVVGKMMGTSIEEITHIDEDKKLISWSRGLISKRATDRKHVLIPLGPNLTRSFITLNIPGPIGKMVSVMFKSTIEKAFDDLNRGIEREALSSEPLGYR